MAALLKMRAQKKNDKKFLKDKKGCDERPKERT